MTDPTSALPAAGWYPDPAGSGRIRWWDGRSWTEHYAATGQLAPGGAAQPYSPSANQPIPRAPEGTSPYTPFVWLLALLPAIDVIRLALEVATGSLEAELDAIIANPTASSPFTDQTLLDYGISFVLLALGMLFTVLDYRALRAAGIPQPFHWAWGLFLIAGAPVYIIGRSIVARRRTGGGLAPMFVNLALMAVSLVVGVVIAVGAMQMVFESVPLG